MRTTVQRRVIMEQLRMHGDHPGAEAIYAEVRTLLPHISLGTVYRNLDILVKHGLIQRLDFGGDHSHYDPNPDSHPHFLCTACRSVYDMRWQKGKLPAVEKFINPADLKDCVVESVTLVANGLCRECMQ